jgi:hypothetical protein
VKDESLTTYPLIKCGVHGRELAPAFMVCVHVLAGAPIAHRVEPDDDPGEALCARCSVHPHIKHCRVVCLHCLNKTIGGRR